MKVFSLIQQAVTRYRKAVAKVSGLGRAAGSGRGRRGDQYGASWRRRRETGRRGKGKCGSRAASSEPPARTCGRKVLGALGLGRDRHPHSPWTLPGSSGLRSGRPGSRSRHRARQSAARGRRGVAWRGASARPTAGPGNPAPGLSPSRQACRPGLATELWGCGKSWVIP